MAKSPLVLIAILFVMAITMLSFAPTIQGQTMGRPYPEENPNHEEGGPEETPEPTPEEQIRLKNEVCDRFQGTQWLGTDIFDPDHYFFTLRFCEDSPELACKENNGALCQYDRALNNQFVASLASTSLSPLPVYSVINNKTTLETGYSIRDENGDSFWVFDESFSRISVVDLICDPLQVENQRDPTKRTFDVVEYKAGKYNITIKSSLACERWEPPILDGSVEHFLEKGKNPSNANTLVMAFAILLTIIGMIN